MSTRGVLFLLLGIFFLVGAAAATDLTHSAMTSSNTGWIVANGNDQVTITVHVSDGPKENSLQGATVDFSLADDSKDLGTFSAPNGVTGADGIAQTIFKTTTKSGTATIKALVTYHDGSGNPPATITLSGTQKIDHGRALPPPTADYPYSVPAGSVAHVNVTFMDRYNNLVDNKNPDTVHTVHISIQDDEGPIFSGAGDPRDRDLPTDAYGNISFDVQVSTVAGSNSIQVYGLDESSGIPITISSAADSVPCYLMQSHPDPSSWPADGKDEHTFTFTYTVLDKYGNPISNADLWIQPPETGYDFHLITGSAGSVTTRPYGPKNIAGSYTIRATVVNPGTTTAKNMTILCTDIGEAGYCSQTVSYTNLEPVDMIMTASPQTMVSMDVAGATPVSVKAKVVDAYGNGVKGQTVTFSKTSDDPGTFKQSAPSQLAPLSVTTDDTGYATVQFTPGTFTTDKADQKYSDKATATCTVTGTWTNPRSGDVKTPTITFTWKNYPFLSVESEIDNPPPHDTIDVRVWVRGTGAALQPKPIDVVLVIDKSGSMDGDRISQAKDAAKKFVDNMNTGTGNRVGLVSFSTSTTEDQTLTSDFTAVKKKIEGLKANGATQMRRAIYTAITDIKQNGRSDAVKAVILLTDGDWNSDGSILGHGTGWPNGGSYSFSTLNFEPINYRYYDGLGGTLTNSITGYDDQYCDICSSGYTAGSEGTCCKKSGWWTNCYTPDERPSSCSQERPIYNTVCLDGEFTQQNMSIYAGGNSPVRLYALSFVSAPSLTVQDALNATTLSTGGFYKHAPGPTELNDLYTKIAGKLNEQAGGNTQVVTDFSNIQISTPGGAPVGAGDIDKYIKYEFAESGTGSYPSTYTIKKNTILSDPSKNDYFTNVRNDESNWTPTTKQLKFDVGKIILNDYWMVNIRFKVLKPGSITFFGGGGSTVKFTDAITGATQEVTIPSNTTTIPDTSINNPFAPTPTLTVSDIKVASGTTDPNLWTVTWKTSYDGGSIVHEKLLYSDSSSVSCSALPTPPPCQVYTTRPDDIPGTNSLKTTDGTLTVDTSSWKSGQKYYLTLWAETNDGQKNWGDTSYTKTDGSKKAYIKLQ